MSTTEPIRNKTDLQKFMDYYSAIQPNPRNQALILLGLYTALRIGDILQLKWRMVYDFNKHHFFDHIYVNEQKTQKLNVIALNQHVKASLIVYFEIRNPEPEDYIFTKRTTPQRPINRSQAFRIVQKAAECTTHSHNISCHSLRKTFGYHAWKQGTQPAMLMDIYNHSSYNVISELIRTKKTKFLQILTLEYNAAQKIKKISKRTKVFFHLSDLIYMNATLSYKMLHFYYSLFIFYSFYQILFTPHADSYSYILHKFPC